MEQPPLSHNNAHQDPDTMFAKRVPPQSGSQPFTDPFHQHVWKCRMGWLGPFVTVTKTMFDHCSRIPEGVDQHSQLTKLCTMKMVLTLVSMRDCLQLQNHGWLAPCKTTGQRLVGGKRSICSAGGHGSADATSRSDAEDMGDGGHGRCRCHFWCSTTKKMKLLASFFYCNPLMIFLASSFEIAPNWHVQFSPMTVYKDLCRNRANLIICKCRTIWIVQDRKWTCNLVDQTI